MQNKNQYLSSSDVSRILNVPVVSIQKWLKDGRLKSYRVGGNYRIRPEDLLIYLENLSNPPFAMVQFKKDIANHFKDKAELEIYLSEAKDKTDWAVRGAKVRNYEAGTGPKPWK
ncbi:hypothetical protein ES702_05679 [subsurface metagenome]